MQDMTRPQLNNMRRMVSILIFRLIFADILQVILAGGSGAAQEELRSGDFRYRERVGAAGRGCGRAATSISSARDLAPTRTRTREVRPAQRINA